MRSAAVLIAALCVGLAFWMRKAQAGPVSGSTVNIINDLSTLWSTEAMPLKKNDKQPELDYFEPWEFGRWWEYMDTDFLLKLDKFRGLIGKRFVISTDPEAVGRHRGATAGSYHNVDKHGKVMAVDGFPEGINSVNAKWYEDKAREAGLGGVGFYPHWNGGFGMHVDNGPKGRSWAFNAEGHQVGIDYAFA